MCLSDIAIDWSDHGLWWPDKNIWLARTRSTLDQYGVQADAKLWFTPMHKNLHIVLPDLQVLDMPVNFATNVFTNVIRICRELGKRSMLVCTMCSSLLVKKDAILWAISLSYSDRFFSFTGTLGCNTIVKDPITRQMRRYTALSNRPVSFENSPRYS